MTHVHNYSPEVKKLLRHLITLYDEIEVLSLKHVKDDDTRACIRVLERRCDEIRSLLTNKDFQ